MFPRFAMSEGLQTAGLFTFNAWALDGYQKVFWRDAHLWGKMDPATGAVELHTKKMDTHDGDVLDDITEAVILRGGEVYSIEAARMPTRSPVAATLRW